MPAQPRTHGRQQRIPCGPGKIFHPQLQGIGAATGCAAGNDGLAVRHAPGNQRRLGRHGIDGVNDKIGVGRDQLLFLAGLYEFIDRMHGDVGRDVADALRHHLDLGRAQRAGERMNLAVDVGLGHVVQVDEGEAPHAAARQRLGSPGADTANADNDDMGLPEPLAAGFSVDAGDGGKTTIGHGGILSVWMDGRVNAAASSGPSVAQSCCASLPVSYRVLRLQNCGITPGWQHGSGSAPPG